MTTTVKAKCPGCGDEEGSGVRSLSDLIEDAPDATGKWWCGECGSTSKMSDWFKASQPRTLTDADVEAIARRVVELMREGVP